MICKNELYPYNEGDEFDYESKHQSISKHFIVKKGSCTDECGDTWLYPRNPEFAIHILNYRKKYNWLRELE